MMASGGRDDEAMKLQLLLSCLSLSLSLSHIVDGKCLESLSLSDVKKDEDLIEDQPFRELTEDDRELVANALSYASRMKVLVSHQNCGITITGEVLGCLSPGACLNDEDLIEDQPFRELTEDDRELIANALSYASRMKVLVTHQNCGITITGEVLGCLSPGACLNDEVINIYLELLKDRERREPKKFLKCHFFSTFFYGKVISERGGYDYKSVRKWTSQRKLGYSLLECDKIFVPVNKGKHWCLAVINKKEKKFQYLDSLGGTDKQVMGILKKYIVDEVKDKNGEDIDVTSWKQEFVTDLPNQQNGFDCGVFMIKYADFYSRDIGLCFMQENMPYFRLRTAKEILKLRAD